ncbi:MAG: hypothetical protein WAL08_20260 [Candidatus Sulfotelmatobacter sp.]
MRFPVDADLVVFLYTASKIAFGSIPRLRRNVPKVPARYQIENVPLGSLTEAQTRYFAPYDKKLDAMNYWPVCTYRITNYGHCLLRQYVNPSETSRCVVLIYELALNVDGRRTFSNNCTMSFHTRFSDDRILTTRNAKLKTILDRPPYQVVQECPQVSEPSEMKCIHDTRAQTMGCPVTPLSDPVSILKDVQSEHERFTAHQLSTGAYRPLPGGTSYAIADKAHWRAIRNHLNPFAHRFSLRQFLPAAIVAAALPVFAFLDFAPAAAQAARNVGFSPVVAAEAVILACYLVAGAIIGYVLERQTFVWVFLLTYVSARIFAGANLGPVPYSAFAGSVAYSVAQAKKRRRAVLLPQTTPPN